CSRPAHAEARTETRLLQLTPSNRSVRPLVARSLQGPVSRARAAAPIDTPGPPCQRFPARAQICCKIRHAVSWRELCAAAVVSDSQPPVSLRLQYDIVADRLEMKRV